MSLLSGAYQSVHALFEILPRQGGAEPASPQHLTAESSDRLSTPKRFRDVLVRKVARRRTAKGGNERGGGPITCTARVYDVSLKRRDVVPASTALPPPSALSSSGNDLKLRGGTWS